MKGMISYADANPQNAEFELPPLIGCTITDYGYVQGDIGDFLVLTIAKDGEPVIMDGEQVALIVSRDAELNGGGYIGWVTADTIETWDRE
tara:strand:- start:305 stop:574 length:270 start_codon:yes stop_codon:yes gene_type:complete